MGAFLIANFRDSRVFAKYPCYTNKHIIWNLIFCILLNDQNGRACASSNMPPHRRWCFGQGYHSILNSFSTIDPHHHVKYSRLNCNVKRMVEIDPSVEKID